MILGAIDIGSNAARLLICEVVKHGNETEFNKLNLIRIPLRLGFDVFEKGYIGFRKKKMFLNTMNAFSALMKVYEVDHYIACATSAMREASNSKEIIKEIRVETGVKVEVISGDLEAEIIYENHIAENLNENKVVMTFGGGIDKYHVEFIRGTDEIGSFDSTMYSKVDNISQGIQLRNFFKSDIVYFIFLITQYSFGKRPKNESLVANSLTIPSDAAKKASICFIKCCSPTLSFSQSTKSEDKSISSAVQKQASPFLYSSQMSLCSIGKITNLLGFFSNIGSGKLYKFSVIFVFN